MTMLIDRYFEDDEEESEASGNMAYQPAPGSPNAKKKDKEESDDSEDALDAYMADLEVCYGCFISDLKSIQNVILEIS